MWKGSDAKKTKRLTHEEIKIQLIESIVINDVVETDELNKKADKSSKTWGCSSDDKKYEDIIQTKKKGIITIGYYQRKVFKKFKDKEKLIKLVNQFNVRKTTITFKINIFKLCKKYPKLMKSSIGLGFLKNYYKDIKQICEENLNEFS